MSVAIKNVWGFFLVLLNKPLHVAKLFGHLIFRYHAVIVDVYLRLNRRNHRNKLSSVYLI